MHHGGSALEPCARAAEAIGWFLDGRIEQAVDRLAELSADFPSEPRTVNALRGILRTLEGMARADPDFRASRRRLRRRLLLLVARGEASASATVPGTAEWTDPPVE